MKNRRLWVWAVVLFGMVAVGACKSEFEQVRASGNPERILQTAYELYDKEEYLKSQTLFEIVLNQYRGTAEAEQMFFKYAYTYYYLRQYTLASHYFGNFSATFAYSPFREEALFMSAYSNYKMSPIFRLDQVSSSDAIAGFQEFVNTYPNSSRVSQCNQLIVEMRQKLEQKEFESAKLYYDLKQYQAAIHTLENLLREYPDSDNIEDVHYMLVDASYNYAVQSVFSRREERYKESIEYYRDFVRKYPSSSKRADADKIYNDCREQLQNLMQ